MGRFYEELEEILSVVGKFEIHTGMLTADQKADIKRKLVKEREDIESHTGTAETILAFVDSLLGAL